MTVRSFAAVSPLDNNVYLITDDATRLTAIVDPTIFSEKLWKVVQDEGLILQYIINTHGHFDHVYNNGYFKQQAPDARLLYHPEDEELIGTLVETSARWDLHPIPSPKADAPLQHGDVVQVGGVVVHVLYTPGHTRGGCSFWLPEDGAVITGDTLFCNSVGRYDFPGGSLTSLLQSIDTQLLPLPNDTRVLPGHGQASTIGDERDNNPYLHEAMRRQLGVVD